MNDICGTQERQVMALAHTDGPQTSKDAAKKMVESGALSRQEKWVYEAIRGRYRRFGDFTPKDIAKWLSWPKSNAMSYDKAYEICRRRFSGLEDKGKIDVVWEQLKIKQRDGCRVWRLV